MKNFLQGLVSGRGVINGFILLLITALLCACASMTPGDQQSSASADANSQQWRESQSARLAARAEARWKALVENNIQEAYKYLSPGQRNVVSLQQYRGKFGQLVEWRKAKVLDVQYDSPLAAMVSLEVEYRYSDIRGRVTMESTKALTEKWLYSEGEWWYISVE